MSNNNDDKRFRWQFNKKKNSYLMVDRETGKKYTLPDRESTKFLKDSILKSEGKGTTEFGRAAERLERQDKLPGYKGSYQSIKDSSTVYEGTKIPELKPSTHRAFEEKEKLLNESAQSDKEYKDYIKGLDPKVIADKIRNIETLLDNDFADEDKYKSLRRKLKLQLQALNSQLKDYKPDIKNKPKINY